VSARRAVEARLAGDAAALEASGMSAFERNFRRFLLRDKGEAVVASVASGGRKLARDERNSIEVEDRALPHHTRTRPHHRRPPGPGRA
jgi:hypothetical protein